MKKIFSFLLLINCAGIVIAQDKPEEEVPTGWWKIPKTNARITLGGYVKFDMIHDLNPINSTQFFDVSKIPVDGSKGTNTHLQANESRIFLDFRTPAGNTEFRTYVEGDFYGSSGGFRLRHAYLEIGGKLLAGQTWSNFMDETIIPPTLDFEKPAAYAFARHGMIRYKQSIGASSYLAVALEEPYLAVEEPTQAGKAESFVPDITARFRHTKHWGHIQLSAFGGFVRFRPQTGSKYTVPIYGANLSGQLNFFKKDYFFYQALAGPGISRYRNGLVAAPEADDQLTAITGWGLTAGIRHFWNPKWSTLLMANVGGEENTSQQPGTDLYRVFYSAVNLVWQFHPIAFAGIEYLYGGREDKNEASGTANRIQFSIRVDINKH